MANVLVIWLGRKKYRPFLRFKYANTELSICIINLDRPKRAVANTEYGVNFLKGATLLKTCHVSLKTVGSTRQLRLTLVSGRKKKVNTSAMTAMLPNTHPTLKCMASIMYGIMKLVTKAHTTFQAAPRACVFSRRAELGISEPRR